MRLAWKWIIAFMQGGVTLFETNPHFKEIDQACLGESLPDKKPRCAPAVAGVATPYKAAAWLMLQSYDAQMMDKRVHANGVIVSDPVQRSTTTRRSRVSTRRLYD
jgi:hypothetical protein